MNRSRSAKSYLVNPLGSLVFFVLTAFFYVAIIYYLPLRISSTVHYGNGEPVLVLVEPGMNARTISDQISVLGLTANPAELSRWFMKLGIDRSIRPGIYSIRPGSPWEIARQMTVAVPEVSTVTIFPGETFQEILEDQGPFFASALGDDTLFPEGTRKILPSEISARIAFILPDTYSVSPSSKSCRELVFSAANAWWKKVGSRIIMPEDNHGFLFQTAVFASLVEKEAKIDGDRKIIAGVIKNRYSAGMRLQIDATVVYAWSLKGVVLNRVLYSHLEIDSPFNTYLHAGFPPAPICVPSIKSWEAALQPQDVPYLFYVALPDGSHIFSKTYQEHIEAVMAAREAFDSKSE